MTHIIHASWPVNFNLALHSYADSISGSSKLVNFAMASPHHIKVVFTSSVSTTMGWDVTQDLAPERILSVDEVRPANGYAHAKFVVEHVRIFAVGAISFSSDKCL